MSHKPIPDRPLTGPTWALNLFHMERQTATGAGHLADVIRRRMAAQGTTQRELSETTGIPLVTLNRTLAGHRSATVTQLSMIANALGTTASLLLDEAA